jgi:hypothetical protein
MLNYTKLSRNTYHFRTFTGLELNEFDALYDKINETHAEHEERRLHREDRKRRIGAGHPFKLSLRDRLLMLLTYHRLYVSSTLLGYLLGLGQSNVLKNIRMLEPQVKAVLPLPGKVHKRVRRLTKMDELEELFPGLKAFLDATEQEIPRPGDKARRRTHYSGKKKRHTVKTQITVNSDGLILHKTSHARGSRHDYSLYKWRHPRIPEGVSLGVDLGYDGIRGDYPGLDVLIPFKRRSPGRGKRGVRAKGLTVEEKEFNRLLSGERAVVENVFSRLKKFRVWGGEFRNRLCHYDDMTDIVCGLVNFRLLGVSSL